MVKAILQWHARSEKTKKGMNVWAAGSLYFSVIWLKEQIKLETTFNDELFVHQKKNLENHFEKNKNKS